MGWQVQARVVSSASAASGVTFMLAAEGKQYPYHCAVAHQRPDVQRIEDVTKEPGA